MADSITSGEKTLLRADGHKAELFLSILVPDSILVARLNNASAAREDRAIVYDGGSGSAGEFARILAGQPLWVGTTAGDSDRGVTRVKSITGTATSGTINIAENAGIDWTDDDYLTIKEEYPLFPKFPRFWQTGSGSSLINYMRKDYDIAYTDENEEPPPVAIMGPHRAGMFSSGTIRFYLDSSESYAVAVGATISSTAWTTTAGTIDNAAAEATYLDVTAAQLPKDFARYVWVACTVTDSNGKTMTTRRAFFAHNATPGHAQYPHVDFEITTFNGNWNRGGWNVGLNVRDDGTLIDIPDKALIVIWQDATYGSTDQDIGGWTLNSADARNVLFAGYVRGDTVTRDWAASRVQFQASSITGLLQKTPADGIYIGVNDEFEWCDYENLTFSRALHHLFQWHSTLLEIADVYLPTMTSHQVKEVLDFAGGTLSSQAANFARNFSVYAGICSNKAGQIHVERDINSINAADRGNVQDVCDITEADRRDRPDLTMLRQEEAKVYLVSASGMSWDGSDAGAYISNAPGAVKNDEGRSVRNLERQIFDDQDAANTFAGRIMAIENNDIRELRVPFKGHYLGVLDVVPQEWWRMTLSSGDTERGIALSGRQMVPRTVTARFDMANGTIKASAIMEPEASGEDGLTSDYPSGPPSDPPPDPPAPDPPPGQGDGNTVYIQVEDAIGRTTNFLDASPNWLNVVIPSSTGVMYRMIIDPWVVSAGGTTAVWLACQNGVWMTGDMNRLTPTWTQKLTAAAFATATGKTLSAVRNVKATIAEQNRFYIHALATDDALYVGMTSDGGDTWTFTSIGTITATDVAFGFAVSTHDALKVWSCGADGVLKGSTDGGGSFSTLHTVSNANGPINSIEVPYASNPNDLIIYISAEAGSGGGGIPSGYDGTFEIVHSYDDRVTVDLDTEFGCTDGTGAWWKYVVYKLTVASGTFGTGALEVDICRTAGVNNLHDQRGISDSFTPYLPSLRGLGGTNSIAACPTPTTLAAGNDTADFSIGYIRVEWHNILAYRVSAFRFTALTFLAADEVADTYLMKSIDGASSFSDVTPSEGGSSAFCSMEVATLDGQTIYALVRDDDSEEHHAVVSSDGASNWTEQSDFNSLDPGDADGQASLGAWPADSDLFYLLQYRDPGGSPSDMISYSADQAASWSSKVGDWASVIQSTWGLTKAYASTIVPVWMN